MSDRIEERARFDLIRYANVWEDAWILRQALRPAPGRRILSIASAGDNAFALLAQGAEVVAADLSPAQIALVDLKRAAIRRLSYDELLAFLGIRRGEEDRRSVYERLERDLGSPTRDYWRDRLNAIADGVVHQGKFESYFTMFRNRVLPLVHGRRTVERLMDNRDRAAREEFYHRTWDNWRWRLLFRVFFSRFVMGRLGRDPEFFRYVEGSVAERILGRARYALTVLPTHENPYVEYILTGNYGRVLPLYLRPYVFPELRRNLDGLTLFEGPVDEAARAHQGAGFDGFNLSDIFEYLDEAASAEVYGRLLETARPGARFAYWNMLVPRRLSQSFPDRVRFLEDESRRLFAVRPGLLLQRVCPGRAPGGSPALISAADLRGAAILSAVFVVLLVIAELWRRLGTPKPEWTRKLVHLGGGIACLFFPFLVQSPWVVLAMALTLTALFVLGGKLGFLQEPARGGAEEPGGGVLPAVGLPGLRDDPGPAVALSRGGAGAGGGGRLRGADRQPLRGGALRGRGRAQEPGGLAGLPGAGVPGDPSAGAAADRPAASGLRAGGAAGGGRW